MITRRTNEVCRVRGIIDASHSTSSNRYVQETIRRFRRQRARYISRNPRHWLERQPLSVLCSPVAGI